MFKSIKDIPFNFKIVSISKIRIGESIILEVKMINPNGIHCTSYIEK